MSTTGPSGPRDFHTTHWSVVLSAGQSDTPEARDALERLSRGYWYPLYSYVRRRGHDRERARDLTQGFFALLLEREDLRSADPDKGRFRAFLLTALKHFLVNEQEREQAQKRGGGVPPLSIDGKEADTRYGWEPADPLTPEKLFERNWAHSVLERTLERLAAEYESAGKGELFRRLKDHLVSYESEMPYAELTDELGMSAGALRTAAHRMRRRYRKHLRDEIADTVADPSEVDDELRILFSALGTPGAPDAPDARETRP